MQILGAGHLPSTWAPQAAPCSCPSSAFAPGGRGAGGEGEELGWGPGHSCAACPGLPSPYSPSNVPVTFPNVCGGCREGTGEVMDRMRRGCGQRTPKSASEPVGINVLGPPLPTDSTAPAIGQGCRLTIRIVPPSQPLPPPQSQASRFKE